MNLLTSGQLLTFILGIAALIFMHELGHFVAARLLKVEVEEFGLGFPPRIVTLFRAAGTDFTLNWIPLGGFVRLKGENDPEVEGGMAAASPWVRLTVLLAGPFTNILIGLILGIMLVYSLGEPVPNQVLINAVSENSPADQAGLQPGDHFVTIHGVEIEYIQTAQDVIRENVEKETTFVMQRDGETYTVTIVPRADPPPNDGAIGVVLDNETQPVSITEAVVDGSGEFSRIVHALVTLPVQMLRGEVSAEESRLVGYRGMFEIYQQIPSRLWFFMMISISLGILNLLPIPALDGGRIALILPEIFLRKRIPARYENTIHLVGFIVLIALMIWINIQDWVNPIQLPQ